MSLKPRPNKKTLPSWKAEPSSGTLYLQSVCLPTPSALVETSASGTHSRPVLRAGLS